ncbi:MAG: ribulose-phosphate 3-epimerase [Bacillota bacterium]
MAPSLLAADFSCLAQELERAESTGAAHILHLDIMDGHFVPNISFGPGVVRTLRPLSKMLFDVHLMIEKPERYLKEFAEAGAEYISVHVEAVTHLHRVLENIRELGAKPAIALNPATSLSTIEEALPLVDMVLLMSVNPGFGGQDFIYQVLGKIRRLKDMLEERELNIPIEVDGGINRETGLLVAEAGAEILVAGSAVFGRQDLSQAVAEILEAAKKGRQNFLKGRNKGQYG